MSDCAPCQRPLFTKALCAGANGGLINAAQWLMPENERETETLSVDEIADALSPYLTKPLLAGQLASIARYLALLKKWNQTIPLTSIEEDSQLLSWHFGESIFAGSLLSIERGRLADVGSGAGFPGLPLKIAFPELEVALIEPNSKKCAFLREIQAVLGLSGVEIVRGRYEDLSVAPASFDFVCSRALGGYRRLLQWSRVALKPKGHVVLWLGMEDSTLLSRTKGWNWQLPVKIPESRRRVLLLGRPFS